MKTLLTAFIFCVISIFNINAQNTEKIKGDRMVTTIETEVDAFNTIALDEHFDIEIIHSNKPLVIIETDSNLHDVITFNVTDSVLSFDFLKKITSKKRLSIKVNYTNTLKTITTKDNAEINAISPIKSNTFKINANDASKINMYVNTTNFELTGKGKCKITLNLNCENMTVSLKDYAKLNTQINSKKSQFILYEKANVNINGYTDTATIEANNSATFIGKDLTTKNVIATAEISSDITLEAIDNIAIEASGNSTISIYGNPEIAVKRLVDTSKIQKKLR